MKVGFVSLGCSKNLVDSEKMMGMLVSGQHELVSDPRRQKRSLSILAVLSIPRKKKRLPLFSKWQSIRRINANV